MPSLNLEYEKLGEPLLIKILQIADIMDVPPRVVIRSWLLAKCEESNCCMGEPEQGESQPSPTPTSDLEKVLCQRSQSQ